MWRSSSSHDQGEVLEAGRGERAARAPACPQVPDDSRGRAGPEAGDEYLALVARIRAGEEEVLPVLIERYAGVVHHAARSLLGPGLRSRLDSLDLVQSVYGALLVGLRAGKFDISTPERLIALTLTLLRCEAAHQWRHWRRELRWVHAREEAAQGFLVTAQTDGEDDPAQIASFNDEVGTILGQFDDLDRHLLELRLKGYTTREAADALSLDAGYLRVRLGRLRKRFSGFHTGRTSN